MKPQKKKDKMPQTKKKSIEGLLAKIEKIEKKLDLLNVLGRTMPVVIISVCALVGSLIYISSVATWPTVDFSLPQTGEDITITNEFFMIYPENYSSIALPDEIIGLSTKGFYTNGEIVVFLAQKSGGEILEIGEGYRGLEKGEYKTSWAKVPQGRYSVWAEVVNTDGTRTRSASVTIDIQ